MNLKDILTTIVFVAIILLIYYIPYSQQKRQDKEIKKMQDNLKKGDKVITYSGLSGTIEKIEEDKVIINTNPDKVKLAIEKWAIAGLDDRTVE